MDEYDEELYVIVRWGDGVHQLRQHNVAVQEFLSESNAITVVTDPVPYEEAVALFTLCPNRIKHELVYPLKK